MIDLTNPIFHDAEKAREYLEAQRWPEGPFALTATPSIKPRFSAARARAPASTSARPASIPTP